MASIARVCHSTVDSTNHTAPNDGFSAAAT
jgi:hypothetical protein